MSDQNQKINKTIANLVKFEASVEKGKKAKGTKIASIKRDLPIIQIAPFTQ